MFGKSLVRVLAPLTLVAALGACTQSSGALQPGIVNTAAAPGGVPAGYRGEQGRVVAVNETRLRGGGGSGMNDGTLTGGGIGLAGGAMAGAAIGRGSVGGTLIGGLLGAVGGAIAGTLINQRTGTQRGVEVTVQKDDGQTVTIAQPDSGNIQPGDHVMIGYDQNGVARAVPDGSQGGQGGQRDYQPQQSYPPQRDYSQPPQDYSPHAPQRIDYQPR
jgi:outer membrane lipoprotein SlyB